MFTRCTICGTRISGEYYRFSDGSVYCRGCGEHLPRCDRCGKPTARYHEVNGHTLCATCSEEARKCHLCSGPIIGEYREYSNGMVVCQACHLTCKRCSACNIPVRGEGHAVGGKILCDGCLRDVKTCDCCGGPIIPGDTWMRLQVTGGTFCQGCSQSARRCDSCQRPVREGEEWSLGDGRILCAECNGKAVFDMVVASRLFEEMRGFLRSEFGVFTEREVRLKMVNRDGLKRMHPGSASEGMAMRGLFSAKKGESYFTIFMLYGLAAIDFQAVAAHEFVHAWQTDHCPPNQSLPLMEGFARWIEYQVYLKMGGRDEATLLESGDDPVYGEGLQRIRQIARDRGYIGLIQFVRTQVS